MACNTLSFLEDGKDRRLLAHPGHCLGSEHTSRVCSFPAVPGTVHIPRTRWDSKPCRDSSCTPFPPVTTQHRLSRSHTGRQFWSLLGRHSPNRGARFRGHWHGFGQKLPRSGPAGRTGRRPPARHSFHCEHSSLPAAKWKASWLVFPISQPDHITSQSSKMQTPVFYILLTSICCPNRISSANNMNCWVWKVW